MRNPIAALSTALYSFAFPPACLACERPAADSSGGVCAECWSRLERPSGPACARCGVPIVAPGSAALADPLCGRCVGHPPPIDGVRSAALYTGSARNILRAFKYAGADYLAPHLASRMAVNLRSAEADVVVPVPATRREIREKGYFPAGLLAREVATQLALPLSTRLLRKVRETERQTKLDLARRRRNVAACFAAGIAPRAVLLIDDVATSGATLFECARSLAAAGAERVVAGVFARATTEDS